MSTTGIFLETPDLLTLILGFVCICRGSNLSQVPRRPPAEGGSPPTRQSGFVPVPHNPAPEKQTGHFALNTAMHFTVRFGTSTYFSTAPYFKMQFFLSGLRHDPRRLDDGNSTEVVRGTANVSVNRCRGFSAHQIPDFLQAAPPSANVSWNGAFSAQDNQCPLRNRLWSAGGPASPASGFH